MKILNKISILTLAIFLVIVGCKKKDDPHDVIIIEDKICDVNDPSTDLLWLSELISLAETDISPDYFGTIYLISDEEKEVFWVSMMLEAEQLNGHWFNCDGSRVEVDQDSLIPWPNPSKIIYAKYQPDLIWDYPIKPGTVEWNELEDFEQRVVALQIPPNIFSKLNTTSLIEQCLSYPLLSLISAYDKVSGFIDNLKRTFDAFNVLLLRSDAGKLLHAKYEKIKPGDINENWTSIQQGQYALNLIYIETFLSQFEILNKLSSQEKKKLARELLIKFEEKSKYPELYGILSQEKIGLCLVRILKLEGALNAIPAYVSYDDLMYFHETGFLRDYNLLAAIIVMAENYIK